jgi:hypothetical protein
MSDIDQDQDQHHHQQQESVSNEHRNYRRRDENLTKWRKDKVFTLWSKGWSQTKIANELQCAQSTVSEDLALIFKQTEDNLANHLSEGIPRQWAQCLQGLKTIMSEGWNIYDSISADPTIRITDKTSVLALIKDCYKHMLDLNADSTIVSECINFSKRANNKLQLYQPQPQLERVEQTQPIEIEEQGVAAEVEEGEEVEEEQQ